ncbi:hypothetical protein [Pedobacter arcticus]|uniref:hypothetical protein n=1 Tax=Pedobacter arcticus TaxID=752140 RepID=UPI00031D68EB|nr:hypothetical protein [Pedobacter arcticus]
MQGLVIAIIIIGFLYNVYNNFKKEAEKAAVRAKEAEELQKATQRVPAVENKRATSYREVVEQPAFQTTYNKPLTPEYAPVESFGDHKQDYFKERARAKQYTDAKVSKKTPVLDYYNPEVASEEVLANRRIHEQHKHGIQSKQKEKHLAADFNFRQALIYDAILRRPEY